MLQWRNTLLLAACLALPAAAQNPRAARRGAARPIAGPHLRGLQKPYGRFRNANFRNADLRGANLRGADLTGADLRGANLEGVNLGPASAFDRGPQQLVFNGVFCLLLMGGVVFVARKLAGGSFRYAPPGERRAGFGCLGCGGTGAVLLFLLTFAPMNQTRLTEADLSGANLRGATLDQAWLRNANLRGADLTNARIGGTKFWLSYLDGTRLAGATGSYPQYDWAYRPAGDLDIHPGKTDTGLTGDPYFDWIPRDRFQQYAQYRNETAPEIIKALVGVSSIPNQERGQDQNLDDRFPALRPCRARGSRGIALQGRLLIWIINPDKEEDPIPKVLPGELCARRSDRAFTVFVIQYHAHQIGVYNTGSAYRRDADLYAFTWPDRRPLGFLTIPGDPPPDVVSHRSGERVGMVYGEWEPPLIRWLQSLPRPWTHFIRYPPKKSQK